MSEVTMNLTALILLVLKVSIALNVLALGLHATFADATYLFRNPRQLVRAFLSMNVLMPFFALTLCISFNFPPAVKIALGALSVAPVPPIFPIRALKAGGTEKYTIGLLAAAALLAIVVVPVTIEIFQRVLGVPLQMSPGAIAVLVFQTVLAPLLAGIGLRALAPSFAERRAGRIGQAATVLLILSALPVLFGSARAILSLIGSGAAIGLAAFTLAGLFVGRVFGGPERENRRVLSLATANRHPGVAAAIAHTNFPAQKVAVPAIFLYLIVAAILSTLFLAWRARARKKSEAGKQRAA